MPQEIVDPSKASAATAEASFAVLPNAARKFGYVPDFRVCKPGDLILFRGARAGLTDWAISRSQQSAGFTEEHSCWTHAAVFLEEDFVVEAVTDEGVRTRTLYLDVPSRLLRVRRAQTLTDIERYRVALRALRMLGSRYTLGGALRLGWEMIRGGLWTATSSFGHVLICSKVFSDAYLEVTLKQLAGCPITANVTPAHLSATTDLDDVKVPWLKLR